MSEQLPGNDATNLAILSRIGKFVCGLVCIWLLASTATNLWSTPEKSVRLNDEGPATSLLGLFGQGIGGWTIGDSQWQVSLRQVSSNEVDAILVEPPAATGEEAPLSTEHSSKLLELADRLAPEVRRSGPLTVRILQKTGLRLVVFSLGEAEKETLIEGRIALPDGDGWRLVTMTTAHPNQGGDALSAAESLLPYPQDFQILAIRRSASGRPQAELSLAKSHIDDLVATWESTGWVFRDVTDETMPGVDTNGPQSQRMFVGEQGSELRTVWAIAAEGEQYVLVIDTSDSRDAAGVE